IPLLVRTLALRAVLLLTTWVAASLGDVTLAAHQVAMTIWSFLAFALDALAIAAQAIVGRALGAGDRRGVREAMGTMTRWGAWAGSVSGSSSWRCTA
ncbi:MAG TPA: MATE family efflux transporter, partial [Humibacillus xanthopallidus]|nr:MATE family efflux transporter [Humibacillus xanthopallidus]